MLLFIDSMISVLSYRAACPMNVALRTQPSSHLGFERKMRPRPQENLSQSC